MKKTLTVAALGAAAAVSAVVLAAPASAGTANENGQFVQMLNNRGHAITNLNYAIANGEQVCYNIDTVPGWTGADEMNRIYYAFADYTRQDASDFVTAAVHSFCPEFLPGGASNR